MSVGGGSGRDVLVVGAGGHAKVVVETLRAQGDRVAGLIGPAGGEAAGARVIGQDDHLAELRAKGYAFAIVAIGDNARRQALGDRVADAGFELVNAIHPNATLSPSVRIGRGIAIMAGVTVNAETEIGDHAILNTRAGVDHDCVIGAAAHVAPGATLAGGVRIGARTLFGAGATAIPSISICNDAIVGAGAVVVRPLETPGTYVGAPARLLAPAKKA